MQSPVLVTFTKKNMDLLGPKDELRKNILLHSSMTHDVLAVQNLTNQYYYTHFHFKSPFYSVARAHTQMGIP